MDVFIQSNHLDPLIEHIEGIFPFLGHPIHPALQPNIPKIKSGSHLLSSLMNPTKHTANG